MKAGEARVKMEAKAEVKGGEQAAVMLSSFPSLSSQYRDSLTSRRNSFQ